MVLKSNLNIAIIAKAQAKEKEIHLSETDIAVFTFLLKYAIENGIEIEKNKFYLKKTSKEIGEELNLVHMSYNWMNRGLIKLNKAGLINRACKENEKNAEIIIDVSKYIQEG